ncbi:helix-turn-helix domain-containing protein [Haloarculaceae archaeon H-GB2-1]|nr:hypothetical protein [Haloarculaceae archaeon H-GB1-1]MEA5387082.1 helix-turn-helix domain-containing protein [Haloarculaceae archaeon H-GB11]MEA5408587.1 helix-turn-helix domain-containing protein [Haloarculaceae archaeon H-GB2-1]
MQGEDLEAVEYLARSETRVQLLTALAEEHRLRKDELQERTDASRTTIQRNLAGLEERGWITSTNREYACTIAGEWVADDFEGLVQTVREASRLGPVLQHIDTSTFEFDPSSVGFEVTSGTRGHPMKMIQAHAQSLRGATDVRLLLPETGEGPVQALTERTVAGACETTVLVTETVLDVFRTNPACRGYVEEMMQVAEFELLVTDAEIPYYLGVVDDEVQIGVSENGQPIALLTTDSPTAFEWAERTAADYLADSAVVDEL